MPNAGGQPKKVPVLYLLSALTYCTTALPLRRLMFEVTKAVEVVHRQFRKLTKTKGGFVNENSLLKLLVGILNASQRWAHPLHNWNLTQLAIHFLGRLNAHIDLWIPDTTFNPFECLPLTVRHHCSITQLYIIFCVPCITAPPVGQIINEQFCSILSTNSFR
jgi:hypothetical protein